MPPKVQIYHAEDCSQLFSLFIFSYLIYGIPISFSMEFFLGRRFWFGLALGVKLSKKKKRLSWLFVFPVIAEERVSTGKTESCNFQFLVFLNRKNKYRKKAAIGVFKRSED